MQLFASVAKNIAFVTQLTLHVSVCPGLRKYPIFLIGVTRNFAMSNRDKMICLFDVDGTLTAPRQVITSEMQSFIFDQVKPKCKIGVVGGSDLIKIAEQMRGKENLFQFDYSFAENGLVAYKGENEIGCMSIQNYIGEEKLQRFINFSLRYMSELTLPVKRGTFIEFRNGLVNVCPVGRSCTQAEREQFAAYDAEHQIRQKFVDVLRAEFKDLGLVYSIGGQISFDVFPEGWDKTYSLRHIIPADFKEIHFFGDKTDPGGNDFEIFSHPKTIGHKVTCPDDTRRELCKLLCL